MSQPSSKPLPELPPLSSSSQSLPKFTPIALAHLKRILSQAINDEQLDIRWISPLEQALSQLVDAMDSGHWLRGLRLKRRPLRARDTGSTTPNAATRGDNVKGKADNATGSKKPADSRTSDELQGVESQGSVRRSEHAERVRLALVEIDSCITTPKPPSPEAHLNHLVLSIAPSSTVTPFHDLHLNFEVIHHRETCTFTPSAFSLPFFETDSGPRKGQGGSIVCGLSDWTPLDELDESLRRGLRVVGGTFTFKGVLGDETHVCLARVLRLGIYAVLSLQIELSLLRDNHVRLRYPKPKPNLPKLKFAERPSSPDEAPDSSHGSIDSRQASNNRKAPKSTPGGVWGFIARTTGGLRESFMQRDTRPRLIDVPPTPPAVKLPPPSPGFLNTPLLANFSGRPLELVRTFSNHLRLSSSDDAVQNLSFNRSSSNTSQTTFSAMLSRITGDQYIYSTSPEVAFLPPSLLVRLAQRETKRSRRTVSSPRGQQIPHERRVRLTGDEKAGLTSILGWTNIKPGALGEIATRNNLVLGMSGTQAFVRHQSLTVLYAEHVPAQEEPPVKDLIMGPSLGDIRQEGTVRGNEGERPEKIRMASETTSSTLLGENLRANRDTPQTKKAASDPELPRTRLESFRTVPCLPAHWKTYRYYASDGVLDEKLGDFLVSRFQEARDGSLCPREGCGKTLLSHGLDWIHGTVKIIGAAEIENSSGNVSEGDEFDTEIWMWSSCKICERKTTSVRMSDGTFLCSFAKYLELLIYSPFLSSISPALCDHTTTPKSPSTTSPKPGSSISRGRAKDVFSDPLSASVSSVNNLSASRFNILRHFRFRTCTFTFTSSPIESTIFDIQVPRLQIVKNVAEVKKSLPLFSNTADRRVSGPPSSPTTPTTPQGAHKFKETTPFDEHVLGEDEEKKTLRLEITYWWKSLKDHITNLEEYIVKAKGVDDVKVRLKRLPSTPQSDDDDDEDVTPTPRPGSPISKDATRVTALNDAAVRSQSPLPLPFSGTRPPSPVPAGPDHMALLERLRKAFLSQEQSLYTDLSRIPSDSLNDVRREFALRAKAGVKRLQAWQNKHTPLAKDDPEVGEVDCTAVEPDWWGPGAYVAPGSRVIVRENDWGSIIAFALSSSEYKRALTDMIFGRVTAGPDTPVTPSASDGAPSTTLSYFSTYSAGHPSSRDSKLTTTSDATSAASKAAKSTTSKRSGTLPDPDSTEDPFMVWYQAEKKNPYFDMFSAVATRKDHPRDAPGILGLRDVLRHQRSVDSTPPTAPSGSGGVSSRFASLSNSASRFMSLGGTVSPSATGVVMPPNAWSKPAAVEVSMRPAEAEWTSGGQSAHGPPPVGPVYLGAGAERLAEIIQQVEQREGVPFDGSSSGGTVDQHSTMQTSSSAFTMFTSLTASPSTVSNNTVSSRAFSPSASTFGNLSSEKDVSTTSHSERDTTSGSMPSSTVDHSRDSSGLTAIPPPVPAKDDGTKTPSTSTAPSSLPPDSPSVTEVKGIPSASSTGSLTSTLATAMRYVLNPLGSGGMPNASPPSRGHFGLLALNGAIEPNPFSVSTSTPRIDVRPHIKYDFTLGKQVRFSCTVYYARQFDMLRRRCGVSAGDSLNDRAGRGTSSDIDEEGDFSGGEGDDDDPMDVMVDIVRSLERCVGWEAEGGKSKSSFLKSEDDRFIIKTLVNAWNVADLQVLLEMSPSYFRYMDQTSSHASVLAKLMGFYTIEIKNLETGHTRAKADVLVMENLFYGMSISPGRTFDLKGIAGRKVKLKGRAGADDNEELGKSGQDGARSSSAMPASDPNQKLKVRARKPAAARPTHKPLFDGEWIEGQQRSRILVYPHSKAILKEAIKGDAEFLAKSNIMDYSLLLGIDEEKRKIACGLVDTIGSYTFAKTLEYKAKQNLVGSSGKEVTVVPPAEYQQRFVNAMEGYFLSCPDKWSKPAPKYGDPNQVEDLPNVL